MKRTRYEETPARRGSAGRAGEGRRAVAGQAGFTLVEAIIAVAVFGVLITAVTGATVTAIRALTAAYADLRFTSTLSLTEHELRSRAASVRFPFWYKELPDIDGEERLSLPYVDGDKTRTLEVIFADSLLTVGVGAASEDEPADDPGARRVFSGYSAAAWAYLKNQEEEIVGLSFTLTSEAYPERQIIINTRFGGLPLGEVGE